MTKLHCGIGAGSTSLMALSPMLLNALRRSIEDHLCASTGEPVFPFQYPGELYLKVSL